MYTLLLLLLLLLLLIRRVTKRDNSPDTKGHLRVTQLLVEERFGDGQLYR